MTYSYDSGTGPRKRRRWPLVLALAFAGLAGLVLCGGIVLVSLFSGGKPAAVAPTRSATAPAVTPAASRAVSFGDGVWKVTAHPGDGNMPAGTYRVATALAADNTCYWEVTRGANGEITANDLPAGGRPEVTVKTGLWFHTTGCGRWVKEANSGK